MRKIPTREIASEMLRTGLTPADVVTRLAELGHKVSLRTVQRIASASANTTLLPATEHHAVALPDLPQLGNGRMAAALAEAVDILRAIARNPNETAAVRVKAADVIGGLSVIGSSVERAEILRRRAGGPGNV